MTYIPIKFGMSNAGNTSGTTGTVSHQLVLAGGNNITLSQSTNAGSATISISAGAGGGGGYTAGMSNLGNTSGTTGAVQSQLVLAGGNNITLSQSVNGQSATLSVSAAAQTNQTVGLYAVSNTTQSTSATVDARSLSFAAAGNLSVGASNGSLVISNRTSWLNNILGNTVSWSSGSGFANFAYYSATGNASFGASNGTILLSVAPNSHGVSDLGNTSGSTGTFSNRLVFAGGNNITLSQSTAAGGGTITISGGAGGAAGSNTFGMSNLGNTSGTSGTVNGSAVQFAFAGGNNVTLSQSLNGSSGTITISAGGGGGGAFTGGMSNIGNTSGTTGAVGSQLVLAGGNNVTLSQSVNGQSATVTISAGAGGGGGGAQTLNRYQNMDRGTSTTLGVPVATLMMQRLNQENDLFAGNITVSTWLMNMSGTASSGASSTQTIAAHSTTVRIGIYTPVATANTVLTLINSAQTTFGSNATMSANPHYFGNRWLSINSSQWSSAPAFSQGVDYVFAVLMNTAGASTGLSYIGQNYMNSNQRSGYWGVSTSSGNTTMPHGNYWNAIYSATTNALPGAISGNQVNRNNATAIFIPHIIMNNQYTY
jgi:hypothetical protein